MAYTFRLIKGSALSWAELDENFNTMDQQYNSASNSASLAVASANFKGNWSSLTGALNIPATVYHSGEYWNLLANVADVTAHTPGVSANWALLGFVKRSGDTMTGALAQASGTAALPSYTFSGSTGTGVWRPAANTWAVSTAGVERLRIDASGNVGVGTDSPSAKLHVQAGSLAAPAWTVGDVVIATNSTGNSSFFQAHSDVSGGLVFSTPTARARSFVMWSEASGLMSLQNGLPVGGAIRFVNNGAERLTIDTSNNVLVTGSGGLGYGVGSGGTVTQATNKSTDVTLNKPCGMITTHAENSPAGTTFAFFLKSTAIAETDSVIVQAVDGLALFYTMRTGAVSAPGGNGQVGIYVTNVSGAARAEAVRIRFAVIKGAQS